MFTKQREFSTNFSFGNVLVKEASGRLTYPRIFDVAKFWDPRIGLLQNALSFLMNSLLLVRA